MLHEVIILLLKCYIITFHMLCYSISSLKNLEVLDISVNNLSEGLPDNMFTSLLSLRELNMRYCRLPTLPNRCVLLSFSNYNVGGFCMCNYEYLFIPEETIHQVAQHEYNIYLHRIIKTRDTSSIYTIYIKITTLFCTTTKFSAN